MSRTLVSEANFVRATRDAGYKSITAALAELIDAVSNKDDEVAELVERGLGTLPAEMRLTMILVDLEGYSYTEVAQIMETNTGTVKSRVARARGMMREFLTAHDVLAPRRRARPAVSPRVCAMSQR